jgi:hypothetical protein
MTHRFLAFVRLQSLDRQPVDMTQLVGSMKDLFFQRMLEKQLELLINLAPET